LEAGGVNVGAGLIPPPGMDSDSSGSAPSGCLDPILDDALNGERHGCYLRNGQRRLNGIEDAEPEFYNAVSDGLGETDPTRPNDQRFDALLEAMRLLVQICFPKRRRGGR